MKKNLKLKLNAIICILAAFIIIATILPVNFGFGYAQSYSKTKQLKVAVNETPGISTLNPDGTRSGIIIDYLNEISKYTGWTYEYVDVDDTSEMMIAANDGVYDLIGGNYDGLEKTYPNLYYPDYSCGYVQCVLFSRKDDNSFILHNLNSISGKKVGVFQSSNPDYPNAAIERLRAYLAYANVTNYEIVEYNNSKSLINHLNNKDVDLILGNTFSNYDLNVITTFNYREHYLNTSNPLLLEELNSALKCIYEGNPLFATEIYEKNITHNSKLTVTLSNEEKAYIAANPTIKIAVADGFAPLYVGNEQDDDAGIMTEILQLVSDFSGLQIEYVYADKYYDAIELVHSGEADMLGYFLGGSDSAFDMGLALTASYTTLTQSIIKNKSVTFPSTNLRAGILLGRALPNDISEMTSSIIEYNDIKSMIESLDKGEIDFIYGYSTFFERVMIENLFTNVQTISIADNQSEVSFAMSMPVSNTLFTIVNKSLYNISDSIKNQILNNNLTWESMNDYSLSTLIARYPTVFISIVSGIVVLILIILIIAVAFKLRQTRIKNEFKVVSAANNAKSNFLSRMSHEIKTPMNSIISMADLTCMHPEITPSVSDNLQKIRTSSQYLLRLINDILDMSRIDNDKMSLGYEPFSISRTLDELKSMIDTEASRKGVALEFDVNLTHDILNGDVIRIKQVLTNLLSNAIKFTEFGDTITLKAIENGIVEQDKVSITFHVIDTGLGISKEDQKRIFNVFEQSGTNYTKSQGVGLGLSISNSLVQLMNSELKVESELGKGSDFYFTVNLSQGELERPTIDNDNNDQYLKDISILIVEDNELNAEITADLLEIKGAKVAIARNGKDAVEMFSMSDIGEYDAILMDIQMPIMNGFEATKNIRQLPRSDSATIPIITMTANTFNEDVETAFKSGMNAFLSKPIDVNKLYAAILKAKTKS